VVELLWSLSDSEHLESKATKEGWTPLFLAVVPASYYESAVSVLTFLTKKGADVNAQDRLGRTPLAFYIQQQGSYGRERVIDLLKKHGADTEVISDSEGKPVKDCAFEKGCVYNWEDLITNQTPDKVFVVHSLCPLVR
jgi:ankyrin repeat protein